MKNRIFSDLEREMAEHFLKTGEKREGFRVLAHRVRQRNIQIGEDFDLMLKLLNKIKLEGLRHE